MSEIFFKRNYTYQEKNRILIKQNYVPQQATDTILRYEIMYYDNVLIFNSIFGQKSESYKINLYREKRFSKNETKGSMKEEGIKLISNSELLHIILFF